MYFEFSQYLAIGKARRGAYICNRARELRFAVFRRVPRGVSVSLELALLITMLFTVSLDVAAYIAAKTTKTRTIYVLPREREKRARKTR